MSKLTIQLIILTTLVVGWTIFMLYQQVQHKKRMKAIDDRRWNREWEERRRRVWLESEVPTEWIRQSATIPYDEFRPKTDKLSPHKKMDKHTMR